MNTVAIKGLQSFPGDARSPGVRQRGKSAPHSPVLRPLASMHRTCVITRSRSESGLMRWTVQECHDHPDFLRRMVPATDMPPRR